MASPVRAALMLAAAMLAGHALAADIMPMPYQVGNGHPDPTRPGVTVPSLADYIKQLYASRDLRAQALGDGLCTVRYTGGGKPTANAPIVDYWQENKDHVVLLLVKRDFMVACDWTAQPGAREHGTGANRTLCRPQKTGSREAGRAATPDAAAWYCRPCPPSGCSAPEAR